MCGIAGIVSDKSVDLGAVLKALGHRGPDASGSKEVTAAGKKIRFGHTRLSILDLSPAGAQPMASADGRWLITFNGEIYNHLDLREDIKSPFRGHSDTETLVECLSRDGIEETLSKLNGMFAFAALDITRGKLYLARDPFGIKPLYYAMQENGNIAFSSEARGLKLADGVDTAIDLSSVQTFLTLRYVPSPRTMWKGIKRLLPGHYLSMDLRSGKNALHRYIKPVTRRFKGSEEDAVEAYHDVLKRAVRRQLLSDVPVGLFLSGGVDSAIIAALASGTGAKFPCYTVGFAGSHNECEIKEAQETAKVLGLPHYSIDLTPDELWKALPDAVDSIEEPLGTTSTIPMWYLCKRARKDVTVVLTGQGSDEPWGGYFRYQSEIIRGMIPFASALKPFRSFGYIFHLSESIERGLRTLPVRDMPSRFEEAYALFTAKERLKLTGDSYDGGSLTDIDYWLKWSSGTEAEPVEKMMMIDSRMNLADDLLLYGDKISMAASIEARVPMLDLDTVSFIESLPRSYKIRLGKGKIIHKRMAEKYLPKEIVGRPKKGFQVPFSKYARSSWKKGVEDYLLDPSASYFGFLKRQAVESMWKDFLSGRSGQARKIFALLMLSVWWSGQK